MLNDPLRVDRGHLDTGHALASVDETNHAAGHVRLAGIRGYSAEIDVTTPLPSIAQKADWVDPVVGGRFTLDFRNQWALELDGDIGGFGVGSDLSWMQRVGAGWRFARHW